jgi:hypothetical protein
VRFLNVNIKFEVGTIIICTRRIRASETVLRFCEKKKIWHDHSWIIQIVNLSSVINVNLQICNLLLKWQIGKLTMGMTKIIQIMN